MAIPGMGGYAGMWQYDGSSMYPNNILGVQNDLNIYNLTANVDRLEQWAARLNASMPALEARYNNNILAHNQQLGNLTQNNFDALSQIFGKLNFTGLLNAQNGNNNGNSSVKRIPERYILDWIDRMGEGELVSDRINQEIVIKNKDGSDRNISIRERLKELVDEYRKNPDNATLSKKNFEKIWDIVSKYSVDGDISSEDFATLKKIALNPIKDSSADESSTVHDEEEDSSAQEEEAAQETPAEEGTKQRSDNYANGHYNKAGNTQTGNDFADAFLGAGTRCDDANTAMNNVDKFNVIEVIDAANKKCKNEEGETIVDTVLDDCYNWGTGRSHYWWTDDDAAPYINQFTENMSDRAKDIIALLSDSEAAKKANKSTIDNLNQKVKELNDITTALDNSTGHKDGDDLTDAERAKLSKAFNGLHKAIKEAEEKLYGVDR